MAPERKPPSFGVFAAANLLQNHIVKHILFLCSQNRLRSPTAEQVFSGHPDIEVASAGLNNGAEVPGTSELVEWADIIFVMEKAHRVKLSQKFRNSADISGAHG